MTDKNLKKILAYCEKLTADGQILTVYWAGGSDSGAYGVRVDDREIIAETHTYQLLIQLVEAHVGYVSFDGSFEAEGEVIYDRKRQCFTGEDSYSETDSDTKECHIEIYLPKDIWFDRLHLEYERQGYGRAQSNARLIVRNGPITELHRACVETIDTLISCGVDEAVGDIEDFDGFHHEIDLSLADFQERGSELVYLISSIYYSFYKGEKKAITIPLTKKNEQHELF